MVKNLHSLVGVFALLSPLCLFSSVSSQDRDEPKLLSFESFNVEKDAGWVLHNYQTLKAKQNDVRFEMNFRDGFYTTMDKDGKIGCVSEVKQNHDDYCKLAYSMSCASGLIATPVDLLKCYFTSNDYYQNKPEAIKNCLPVATDPEIIGRYEDCLGNAGDYRMFLEEDYSYRNYEMFAAYGQESLITLNNVPSMKAHYDLEAFFANTDLVDDSLEKLDQTQCDNNYEFEDVIKPCKVVKPVVQIFFEAEDAKNKDVFNNALVQTSKDYPLMKFAQLFMFVPYGNTKKGADGKFTCATEQICQTNRIFAAFAGLMLAEGSSQPFTIQVFTCYANSADQTPEGFKKCLIASDPAEGEAIYALVAAMAETPEIQEILEANRVLTEKFEVKTFPTVTVNTDKLAVGDDLLQAACESIRGIKPRLCKQVGKTAVTEAKPHEIVMYYNGENSDSVLYVQERMIKMLTTKDSGADVPLRRYLNIRFVPFGDLKVGEDGAPVCGTDDTPNCLASKIVACAQNVYPDAYPGARANKDRVPSFLTCFYSKKWQDQPMLAAMECADKLSNSDIYPWLLQCAKQDTKQNIFLSGKKETAAVVGTFSGKARVTFNGKLLDAGVDVFKTACGLTYDPMPTDCKLVGSSAITLASSLFTILISLFVIVFY